ncbi:MAG: hypothetical protein IPO97_10275 [Sphingomonadales bacterium]|nr:hypothetical protein [Sphingomonadales bacterium]
MARSVIPWGPIPARSILRLIEGVTKAVSVAKVIFCAQLGGDEFAVMMAGGFRRSCDLAGQKLIKWPGTVSCFTADHVRRRVSALQSPRSTDGQTYEALQRNADLAL